MSTKRLLGLLGFLLALVGGILFLRSGLDFSLQLEAILRSLVPLALGVVSIVGAFLLYTKKYREGGLVCVVVGIIGLVVQGVLSEGILLLVAGILALVAVGQRR